MNIILENIIAVLILLFVIKSLIFGTEFNFIKWFKQGSAYYNEYKNWYNNKP